MIVMYDSVDVGQIPTSANAVAGYVDGHWPTYRPLVKRFPRAHHVSIAVFPQDDALCCDCESGDLTPEQVPTWVLRQLKRGVVRPWVYASLDPMIQEVMPALERAGVRRGQYFAWAAHYTGHPHIPPGMDGCQWTSTAMGLNLDESLLWSEVFPAPRPKPNPYAVLTPEEQKAALRNNIPALVAFRKMVWVAAVEGKGPNGYPTKKGWGIHHRKERYELLGHLTGWRS